MSRPGRRDSRLADYIKEEGFTNLLAAVRAPVPASMAAAAAARLTRRKARRVQEAIAFNARRSSIVRLKRVL